MRWYLVLALLSGACGARSEAPLTDADCEAWVGKIRTCPQEGMSLDPKEREANLEWRLAGCKRDIAEAPSEMDALGAGLQRREVRCRTTSTCAAFATCTAQAHADAVDEATRRTMTP